MDRAHIKRQRGALLIVAIGLVAVIGLALFATFAMRYHQRALSVNRAASVRLATIDAALTAFVTQNRRLPCPARGTVASGAAGAGTESINLATGACVPATQIDGVVPWVTLALSERDALDPWNARISYRVQPSLASNTLSLMNMSWCDPAGFPTGASGAALACTAPCTGLVCRNPLNYLYAKGLQVKDGTGAWLNQPSPAWPTAPVPPPPPSSGAAYVLVSHGPNGIGAYTDSGVLQAGASAGNNELPNRNGQALTAATIFVDTARNDTPGALWFDDQLSHPTLSAVLAAAALGARTPH